MNLHDSLQPDLLHRLTDPDPRSKEVEPIHAWFIDNRRLRELVKLNLEELLNATNRSLRVDPRAYPELERSEIHVDAGAHPHVATSVLNFGLPPFCGKTVARLDPREVKQAVKAAIESFEPRITVEEVSNDDEFTWEPFDDTLAADHNIFRLKIKCQLWGKRVPEEVVFKTRFDCESGAVTVQDER